MRPGPPSGRCSVCATRQPSHFDASRARPGQRATRAVRVGLEQVHLPWNQAGWGLRGRGRAARRPWRARRTLGAQPSLSLRARPRGPRHRRGSVQDRKAILERARTRSRGVIVRRERTGAAAGGLEELGGAAARQRRRERRASRLEEGHGGLEGRNGGCSERSHAQAQVASQQSRLPKEADGGDAKRHREQHEEVPADSPIVSGQAMKPTERQRELREQRDVAVVQRPALLGRSGTRIYRLRWVKPNHRPRQRLFALFLLIFFLHSPICLPTSFPSFSRHLLPLRFVTRFVFRFVGRVRRWCLTRPTARGRRTAPGFRPAARRTQSPR